MKIFEIDVIFFLILKIPLRALTGKAYILAQMDKALDFNSSSCRYLLSCGTLRERRRLREQILRMNKQLYQLARSDILFKFHAPFQPDEFSLCAPTGKAYILTSRIGTGA
ncbi:MAG TPA: hypothetical protein VIQ31_38950 [Phormidium sp.]